MIQIGEDTVNINTIFPFYFVLDHDFLIIKQGESFSKIFTETMQCSLESVAEIVRPWSIHYSYEHFSEFSNQIFIFRFRKTNVLFRAQCIPLSNARCFLFIGTPWIKSTDELVQHKLMISDFALNDPITDMIQLLKLNEMNIEETRELNEILNEKKKILEKKELLYRILVENASDIIFRCDVSGNFTFVNAATLDITGYSPDELIGKSFVEFVPSDFQDHIRGIFQNLVVEEKYKTNIEYPIVTKNGKLVWLSQNLIAIIEDHQITGYSSVAVDITSRKEMEENLETAKQKAEESSRLKERFLANTSHEIRTPMNAILGLSKLLSTTNLDVRQMEFLQAIQSSAENLLVVINDILDISKIESEKLELEMISFNLEDKITTLIRSLQIRASEKNIVLGVDWDSTIIPWIIGDPFRLNQVLMNLIGNAIKFTNEGEVLLLIRLLRKDDKTQSIQFIIRDSGIGIPINKLDGIFDDFIQADNSISRKYGGTGLGLAISRRITKLMGGEIHVLSDLGVGSEFSFELQFPVAEEDFSIHNREEIIYSSLNARHVLLVEDNEFNQLLAISILGQWNLIVDQAYNGRDAIEKLKSKSYDIILMDIQMPVMGGVEATKIIRNDLKIETPVLALTANAMKSELEEYVAGGMNACITKPFDQEDLYRVMCSLLFANQKGV